MKKWRNLAGGGGGGWGKVENKSGIWNRTSEGQRADSFQRRDQPTAASYRISVTFRRLYIPF